MLSMAAEEQGSAFLGRFIVYFNSVCLNVCLKCKEKKRSKGALEAYSRPACKGLAFLGLVYCLLVSLNWLLSRQELIFVSDPRLSNMLPMVITTQLIIEVP